MQEFLIQLVSTHSFLFTYATITVIAFFEGPIISMVCGALLRLGYFSLLPIYIALMLGDLIGDVAWYYIGRFYGLNFIKRFGKYFNITEESIEKVKKIFHRYKWPILITSKTTNGFGLSLATLMTAGMVHIPLWRFIGINALGQFIWSGILLATGYFFSQMYLQITNVLGRISLIAGFILLITGFIQFRKYLQTKINQ